MATVTNTQILTIKNDVMSMPGGTELILIVVVLLLLFGAKKIPELMRGMGRGIREFKNAKEANTDS